MELRVLDKDLLTIKVLDVFESLIWTIRYYEYGDFEIFTEFDNDLLYYLQSDNYLVLDDVTMIIEDVQILSSLENGNKLQITGRSLESILERRIVDSQTILNGNFQTEVQRILNENIINPSNPYRKINGVTFESSTDPLITELAVSGQYFGDYVYDVISNLCKEKNIGFKVSLDLETNNFVFKLYSGADRSYNQNTNPFIVFSPKYDNLGNTNYRESKKKLKTSILVAGQGDVSTRLSILVENSAEAKTGLDRREMYNDAGDISRVTSSGTLLDSVYLLELEQRGKEKLAENSFEQVFDGSIEPGAMYSFGTDFFMGDIVQLENEYGLQGVAQVTEIIRSQDSSGEKTLPTFTQIS